MSHRSWKKAKISHRSCEKKLKYFNGLNNNWQ